MYNILIKQFKGAYMFSFLILIMLYVIPCIYYFIQDIKKNNYKHLWKWIITTILLLVALYLKSINL